MTLSFSGPSRSQLQHNVMKKNHLKLDKKSEYPALQQFLSSAVEHLALCHSFNTLDFEQ